MSAEATRMQDLASEFSKKIPGSYPGPLQWEVATSSPAGRPSPALAQPGLWPGTAPLGEGAPVLGPKPWSPSTFQPWLRPWVYQM